jgi:hypothetical protein
MTIACQFIIYIDTDPLDDPSTIADPDAILRQATAQARSQQFNFNRAKNISLCVRKDDQMYYTGADKQNLRFSNQGTAYIIQVTSAMDFNGGTISTPIDAGSVYLDWNVCFDIPQINPSALLLTSWVDSIPTTYNFVNIYKDGDYSFNVSGSITVEPNQAYVAHFDFTQFDATDVDPLAAQLSINLSTNIRNNDKLLATLVAPETISTQSSALLFTGPDGVINLSKSTSSPYPNTLAESATGSGTIKIVFTPVSF